MVAPLYVDVPVLESIAKGLEIESIRPIDEFAYKINRWCNDHLKNQGSSYRIGKINEVLNSRVYRNSDFNPTYFSGYANKKEYYKIREKMEGKTIYLIATSDYKLPGLGNVATTQEIAKRSEISIRAAKNAGAKEVRLILPLMLYQRQDQDLEDHDEKYTGQSDSLNLELEILKLCGVDEIITIDPHSYKQKKFCDRIGIRFTVLPHIPLYAHYIMYRSNWDIGENGSNLVFLGPDKGSWDTVNALLQVEGLHHAGAILTKKIREAPNDPHKVVIALKDEDSGYPPLINFSGLEGKILVPVDDMIDTAGTQQKSIRTILEDGIKHNGYTFANPRHICIIVTHPIFSGENYVDAQQRLNMEGVKEVVFTNTVPTWETEQISELKERSSMLRIANYFFNAILAREMNQDITTVFSVEAMLKNPEKFGHLYHIKPSELKSKE